MARRDSEAFTAFVLASQPRLRRTAYLICGDWELASDHVQEALIRVYRHWPRLRSEPEAHAYARKAVVSVVIDALDLVGELCVGDLALVLGTTEDAVGYGLRILRTAGLVQTRKAVRLVEQRHDDRQQRGR